MNDILIIRKPKTNVELEKEYQLRWRILFEPWNQPKGSEKDSFEKEAEHFIAILNDRIVGTARFHLLKEKIGQIKYLVVDEKLRLKKIGSNLLEAIHYTARNKGLRYILLNARESSRLFFEKKGYEVIEEGPLLFNAIKLFKMKLNIKKIKRF
ncbi:MAG: GNAT family N-acetyltransferase [Candidatus Lokiarchaeota archaeon]|nr:GNAT family N-acetyltransferase [Candidatus Lokiarchaeota archaeon]